MRKADDVATVYLGGGTPSALSASMLSQLFGTIGEEYGAVDKKEEITIECNPDDIDNTFADALRGWPVNRVSIGIQSFSDERLRFLHRRHTAAQAHEAVARVRAAGITNISIDLMFGFPGQTLAQWQYDIEEALALEADHISAYSLTYEEGTPLYQMLQRQQVREISDSDYIIMYKKLVERLEEAGYEHYEISNFAREGHRSLHNGNYWNGTPYLGIGAGAHSYDGVCRMSNVADIDQYITAISQGRQPAEIEHLTTEEHYNDMVATALRTAEGISLQQVQDRFGEESARYLLANAAKSLSRQWLVLENGRLHLSLEGIMVSNTVMSDLMMV